MNLRAALGDLDVLVAESKPATKDLAPFFRALRPLVADAEPTIRDLRFLIKKSGPGNDLIDLTRKQPRLAELASVAFPRSIRALQKSQPVVEYIRPYTPDFAGWLTKFGQGASNYDAHGHFARIQPMFNPFSLTSTPLLGDVLTPVQDATRLAGPRDDPVVPVPGRRDAAAARRLRAVARRVGRLRPQHGAAGAMRRIFAIAVVLGVRRDGARAGRRRARTRTARATRSARSSTTSRARSRART